MDLDVDGSCPGKYLICELDEDSGKAAWYVVTLASATDENATGSRTSGRSGGGGVSSFKRAVAGNTISSTSSSSDGVRPRFRF